MSGYLPEHETDALARLGVLLEQLEGLVAVGTHADFGELSEKEIRFFMYGVQDVVTRCNAAFMDHNEAQTDARIRAQAQEATHEAH